MFFHKLVALIKEKTNAKYEKVPTSESSGQNDVRGASPSNQPSQFVDGEICFVSTKLHRPEDRLVSHQVDKVHCFESSIEVCDLPDGLRGRLPSRNYRYCEPQGFMCSVRESGGTLDGGKTTVQAPFLTNYKPTDVFDTRSRLVVNQPVFQRGSLGFYNPFTSIATGDFIRSQLVANEDERREAKVLESHDEPPSEVIDTAMLDELPPVYEDEAFGDADEDGFVAEDSFQAADGTTVYISQTDDSDELEELEAA